MKIEVAKEDREILEKVGFKFKPHHSDGFQGLIFFDNGYGLSIVRFGFDPSSSGRCYSSYTDNEHEYEVAVLLGTKEKYDLTYPAEIGDDVLPRQTCNDIVGLVDRVKNLEGVKTNE